MVLNVRNVPDALMKKLKSNAALNGVTLREYVLMQLGGDDLRPNAEFAVDTTKDQSALGGRGSRGAHPAENTQESPKPAVCRHGRPVADYCPSCVKGKQ